MSADGPEATRCSYCGELGCSPELHDPQGSELAWRVTSGALLGATVVGLLALPWWVRRIDRVDAPPGHPLRRHREDQVVTTVVSAVLMAIVTLTALLAAWVQVGVDRRVTGWSGPLQASESPLSHTEPEDELDEILALLAEGDARQAELGGRQLVRVAPQLRAEDVGRIASLHERWSSWLARGVPRPDRAAALREALRAAAGAGSAPAADLLATYYLRFSSAEREQTLDALVGCSSPDAVEQILRGEANRTSHLHPLSRGLAGRLPTVCVADLAGALLEHARVFPDQRHSDYEAVAAACDAAPALMRRKAATVIGQEWIIVARSDDRAHPRHHAVRHLAHALACADEPLLLEALRTRPEDLPALTEAELELVRYRRGLMTIEHLLDRAAAAPVLREVMNDHYRGTAPWRDPVLAYERDLDGEGDR